MEIKRRIVTLLIAVMVCFLGTTYDFSIVDGISKDATSIAYANSLKRPTIKVSTSSYNSLKISWSKVSGAQKYYNIESLFGSELCQSEIVAANKSLNDFMYKLMYLRRTVNKLTAEYGKRRLKQFSL